MTLSFRDRRPGRTRSTLTALLATVLFAAPLAACGDDDDPSENEASAESASPSASASASEEALAGLGELDELVIATGFAVTDLDPLENGFWGPEFGFGALLMKPVGDGELEPWLLESLEQEDDTTWRLDLRDDLRFHNGAALDADALAATMAFHLEENTSVTPLLPDAEVSVDGEDVLLDTGEPVVFVPSLLAHESRFPIFDHAAYEDYRDGGGDPEDLVEAKIWSGPYVPTSLTSEALEMEPSPEYFSDPQLSKLTLRFIPDEQARILAVRNGEADLALYPPSTAARELAGRDDALYLTQPEGTAASGFMLVINQRQGVLAEVEVRNAVREAIDYRELAEDVLNGLYDTATGFYPDFLPYAEANQVSDPDAAADRLEQAGWVAEDGGTRTKDGEQLAFDLLTYPQQPDSEAIAVAMQAQLATVGFDVSVRQVDDINAALDDESGWDAAVLGNGALDWTQSDPVSALVNLFGEDGDANYGGVSDAELDELIAELLGETDTAARDDLMREVQRIVVEEQAYSLYLTLKRVPVVASPRLRDYVVPPAALLFVDSFS